MNKELTVKELRNKLRSFPPDLPIKQYRNGNCVAIKDCRLVVAEEVNEEDAELKPIFACIY